MSGAELCITRLSAWAPGIEGAAEWDEWALGKKEMRRSREAPELAYSDPMFRRRLSQISRMTIQVVHDLYPLGENTKMIFLSFRGEVSRQFRINKMQAEDGALMPAAFSLSVFNAPPALASIALGLKGGYSALYPGNDSFASGLSAAKAALLSGEELIFVYADEELPPEYSSLAPDNPPPFAFGLLLSRKPGPVPLPLNGAEQSPAEFLKTLLVGGNIHVSP